MNNEQRWLLVVNVVEVHDAGGGHQLQDVEAVADGQAAVVELAALLPLAAGVAGARPLVADLPQLVHGQQADVPAGQDQVKVTLQGLLDFRAHQRVQAKVGQGRVRVDLAHILYAWQSKTFFETCFLLKAFSQAPGHQNSITKQLNQRQVSVLHLFFHCLTAVLSVVL